VLQWLVDNYNLMAEDARSDQNAAFRSACDSGNMRAAEWLADRFGLAKSDATAKHNAAAVRATRRYSWATRGWLVTRFQISEAEIDEAVEWRKRRKKKIKPIKNMNPESDASLVRKMRRLG
jgi:hypothetical protein